MRMSSLESLQRVPLLAELEDEALDELAGFARLRHLKRKEVLYSEGETYRGMFVVLDGIAVVYKLSEDGRMLVLHVCRPGDVLGEGPLLEPAAAVHKAHARVTRDGDILFLPRERFVPFLRRHPEVLWELFRATAGRVEELGQQLENVTMREVSARLARYLLREIDAGEAQGQETLSVVLPIAKSSLASYLGTVHETLSRTFARFIAQGVVRVDGSRVTILDLARLKRLV
jgi:CRP/FNR family transcriptional regulator